MPDDDASPFTTEVELSYEIPDDFEARVEEIVDRRMDERARQAFESSGER